MSKGQKKTGVPESRERKKKILKVGGLWVDPMSFPAFDSDKDLDGPT